LPLRYEITNDGTGPAASFRHICSTVISEGGVQETGFPRVVKRMTTSLTTLNDADLYPLIAIRLKSGYFSSTVRASLFSLVCTSTAAYGWTFILNPTVTGTAFSWTSLANSSIEYDISRTSATKVSGGTELLAGVSQSVNEGRAEAAITTDFALGSSIAGVSDILVLAVQRMTGTTESFYGALNINDKM